MEISRLAGAGLLTAGLAAGVAVSPNLVDVRGSGHTDLPSTQVGTLHDVGSTGAFPLEAVSATVKMDRIVEGAYRGIITVPHPEGVEENNHLEAQLFDRENKPFDVILDVNGSGRQDWDGKLKRYELVSFTIKQKTPITTASGICSRLGHFESACSALLTSETPGGNWTGFLPAQGFLLLTSTPKVSNSKGEVKEMKADKKPQMNKRVRDATNEGAKADADGQGSKATPSYLKWDLTLNNPLPSTIDSGVLEGSLALALLATLIAAVRLLVSRESGLAAPIGEVSFDFNRSWGTNLGVGATILSFLVGGAIFLQSQYSNYITTYLLLAGLFAVFIPLGGTLYGLIRPEGSLGIHSYVGWYLLASGVVLWGAFGQLLVVGLLFRELELARVLSSQGSYLLILMSKALLVFLVSYSFLTARGISLRIPKDRPIDTKVAAAPLPMI